MMVITRPSAVAALAAYAEFISRDSVDAALRFFESADATFASLAEAPGMGREHPCDAPRLSGLRVWHVAGFPKHLIFYVPIPGGVEIVNVIHGARDIETALGAE